MQQDNTIFELQKLLGKQAEQIALLENELLVTNQALQESSSLADALEADLEHAINNLTKFTIIKQFNTMA